MESHRRPRHESVWENLADIESSMEAEARLEERGEVHDLRQAEEQEITLVSCLQACMGAAVQLRLVASPEYVEMVVTDVAATWVVGRSVRGVTLIPLDRVEVVRGLTTRAESRHRAISSSLSFRSRLRELARDRPITIEADVSSYRGRVYSVGSDWVDIECNGERLTVALGHIRRVDAA